MDAGQITRCPILFQDDHLIAVDKPEGVLSHPNASGRARCAFEGRYDFTARRFATPDRPVWLIHRLDQDTSGVLLAAWDEATAERCRTLFEEGRIRKIYLALVLGRPKTPSGLWRDHVATVRGTDRVRSEVRRGPPPNAELRYEMKQNAPADRCALLQLLLMTGRTHQVRVQAAARGLPLAGDPIYGDFVCNREWRKRFGLRRLFLHARRLEFPHPQRGRAISIESPLPPELEDCLAQLRFQPIPGKVPKGSGAVKA